MHLQPRHWIVLSGLSWLVMGLALTLKGIRIAPEKSGWISGLALTLGYLKGTVVLSKAAHRIMHRLAALPAPIAFAQVYDMKYLMLLACMIVLGVSFRFLPIPPTLHAAVDLAIGAALTRGSIYFLAQKK